VGQFLLHSSSRCYLFPHHTHIGTRRTAHQSHSHGLNIDNRIVASSTTASLCHQQHGLWLGHHRQPRRSRRRRRALGSEETHGVDELGMSLNSDTIHNLNSLRLFGHFQIFFHGSGPAKSSKHPHSQGRMFKFELVEVTTLWW
jgi:hypothetical protein